MKLTFWNLIGRFIGHIVAIRMIWIAVPVMSRLVFIWGQDQHSDTFSLIFHKYPHEARRMEAVYRWGTEWLLAHGIDVPVHKRQFFPWGEL